MKKYAIIDQTNGDWFEEIFDTEAEAIERANHNWNAMSLYDKNRRASYYIAMCELDEDGCVDYETVMVLKEYK